MRRRWYEISFIAVDGIIPLSVCLSVTFVHCGQIAEVINPVSFAYGSHTSLPDDVKIWLTLVTLSSLKSSETFDDELRPNGGR